MIKVHLIWIRILGFDPLYNALQAPFEDADRELNLQEIITIMHNEGVVQSDTEQNRLKSDILNVYDGDLKSFLPNFSLGAS